MKKRTLIIGAVVVLALAIVVLLIQDGRGPGKEGPDGRTDGDELVSGGDLDFRDVGARLEYRFKPGKVYRFDFQRKVKLEAGGEPLVDLDLGGPLAVHGIEAEARYLDLILELDPGGEQAADLPAGAKTILVHIRVDRRGRVAGLRWNKETTVDQKNLVRDIIASFFKALPAAGSKPEGEAGGLLDSIFGGGSTELTYLVGGTDTFGAFLDELRIRAGENLLKLEGTKKEYTRAPVPVEIENSTFSLDWDPALGYFKNSRGEERFRVGGEGLTLDAFGGYEFDFQGVDDSTMASSDLLAFTIAGSITEVEGGADSAITFDEAAILPWTDLKNMLGALQPGTPEEAKQQLFHSLSESMKRDPGIADAALKVAANYTAEDDQFQMVMGSVAYSGAPLAQDLLVNFYRDGQLEEGARLSVMNALTMVDQPLTDDALDLVSEEFQNGDTAEMRDAAGLALGSALGNNPNSKDLYQTILDEWKAARGTDREATVIEMIGNSGDVRFFPVLKEALSTKNENFRMQVLSAMRHMYDKQVQELLLEELESHESASMRAAAVEALSAHPWRSAFLEPMKKCVRSQPNDRVRLVCSEFALGERLVRAKMLDVLRGLDAGSLSEDMQAYVAQQLSEN